MRDLAVLFLHLLATVARLAGPGGARAVVAESVLVKQQLLILNRSRKRSPNLRPSDRVVAGLCAPCLPESPSGRSTDSGPRSERHPRRRSQTWLRSSSVRVGGGDEVNGLRRSRPSLRLRRFALCRGSRIALGSQSSLLLGHVGRAARRSFRLRAVRSDDGAPRPRGSPRCRRHRAAWSGGESACPCRAPSAYANFRNRIDTASSVSASPLR